MELKDLAQVQRQGFLALSGDEQAVLAHRELQKFVNKAKICDEAELRATLKAMRGAALKMGFSEYEVATIYYASMLLALKALI